MAREDQALGPMGVTVEVGNGSIAMVHETVVWTIQNGARRCPATRRPAKSMRKRPAARAK